jgi:hypothetical protein
MQRKLFFLFLLGFLWLMRVDAYAQQNVGIGITTPDASAILDLTATDKGMLVPRMTTAQRLAITTPATGLLVYDTNLSQFWYFDGAIWVPLSSGALGPTGPTGLPGANGADGTTGPIGPTGIGIQGPTGPTGLPGTAGTNGVTGPTGLPGTAGTNGVTGPTGLPGTAGTNGVTGPTGPAGPVGCASNNYVIKSNGTSATCGIIYDDGINIGVGNAAPTQKVDITGNLRFSGAIMPNGLAGSAGQVLTSAGAGLSPTWTSATNNLYNQVYQDFGTAQNTINSATWVVLSGLSRTIAVTGNAKILIMTDGGIQNTSGVSDNFTVIDIAVYRDGVLLPDGAYKRITAYNEWSLVSVIQFWSLGVMLNETAGTHTYDIRASESMSSGADAYVNGNGTSVLQGSMYIMVVYQ